MPDISWPLVPIQLRGELHETIWGGRNLVTYAGKAIPAGMRVGESWETALESIAVNPPYQGQSLGEIVRILDERLIGWRPVELVGHRFPLLTKFLDAEQRLSVQVHPDDLYAALHESGKLGKTETWYIVHAEPGSQLVLGLTRTANQDDVRRAVQAGSLESLLYTFPAHAGDVVYVPAGTIHAIGAGIVLYELQEYSDVTYRLYDYGRLQSNGNPRELHVEKSLEVMRFEPADRVVVDPVALPADPGFAGERRVLVACTYFLEEELRFRGVYATTTMASSCHVLSVLQGQCTVCSHGTHLSLEAGDTVVVPAALLDYRIESSTGVHALLSYVPTTDDRKAQAWREGQPATHLLDI
jgi:mannose-6-phosphate isomerase